MPAMEAEGSSALRKEGGAAHLEKPSPCQSSHMGFPQETQLGEGRGHSVASSIPSCPFSCLPNFTLFFKAHFETSVSAASAYQSAFSKKRNMVAEVLTGGVRTSGRDSLCFVVDFEQ